jgi:hypothetical protein
MKLRVILAATAAFAAAAVISACSGGGGGTGYGTTPVTPVATTAPTTAPLSTQQVVRVALPTTPIGVENDPTFGTVGGYTQSTYSQVLGFATGAQIMILNQDTGTPHTLGDTGGSGSFPASGSHLSPTASGGSTFSSGFQTGSLNPGQEVGPFTLAAGTYYIGCFYHYASNQMRDVLVVSASAAPGPQATPAAGQPTPDPGNPGYSY